MRSIVILLNLFYIVLNDAIKHDGIVLLFVVEDAIVDVFL